MSNYIRSSAISIMQSVENLIEHQLLLADNFQSEKSSLMSKIKTRCMLLIII